MGRSGIIVEEYRGKKIVLTDEGYTTPGYLIYCRTINKLKGIIDDDFLEDEAMSAIEAKLRDMHENPDSYFEPDDPARLY